MSDPNSTLVYAAWEVNVTIKSYLHILRDTNFHLLEVSACSRREDERQTLTGKQRKTVAWAVMVLLCPLFFKKKRSTLTACVRGDGHSGKARTPVIYCPVVYGFWRNIATLYFFRTRWENMVPICSIRPLLQPSCIL